MVTQGSLLKFTVHEFNEMLAREGETN